jgi:hypothetical protein
MTDEQRDELATGMDSWEIDCRAKLQAGYGHDYGKAAGLARMSRDLLEENLRKPGSLTVITGL